MESLEVSEAMMSVSAKRELLTSVCRRYQKGSRPEKGRILDEFVQSTGYHRKYALSLLNKPPRARTRPIRRRRRVIYDEIVRGILEKIWQIARYPCGKRLAPILGDLVDALARHGEIDLSDVVKEKLTAISASAIDRLLRPIRLRKRKQRQCQTKPGTILRKQIAVRTSADWDDSRPGFMEVDLVAHCGESAHGEFLHTLVMTDVNTGWTDFSGLLNRSQAVVRQGIEEIVSRLPFPLLGLDSDNGGEFINHQLSQWCTEHQILFTRCRPYRKNDQCYVEQKNWTIVRRTIGYARYEGSEYLKLFQDIYDSLRFHVNYFQACLKLSGKTRQEGRVTKHYDRAKTPLQRLLETDILTPSRRQMLKMVYQTLNPAQLARDVDTACSKLFKSRVRITREATKAA